MTKKVAYRFVVKANSEDIVTASALWLNERSNPEKVELTLQDYLRDLKNWDLEMYTEKWYIENDDVWTFEAIK